MPDGHTDLLHRIYSHGREVLNSCERLRSRLFAQIALEQR